MKIKVYPENRNAYFPKELIENGFHGDIEVKHDVNMRCLLLIHPAATVQEARDCCENILHGLKIGAEHGERTGTTGATPANSGTEKRIPEGAGH